MKKSHIKKISEFYRGVETAETKKELKEMQGKINKFVEKLPYRKLEEMRDPLVGLQQLLIFRMSGKKIMF